MKKKKQMLPKGAKKSNEKASKGKKVKMLKQKKPKGFLPTLLWYFEKRPVFGYVALTLGLMLAVFALERGANYFMASVLQAPQAFDGTVKPIERVPDWANVGSDNSRPYSSYSSGDLVPLMDYDMRVLGSDSTDDATTNARITYSVVYTGNYTLDHVQGVGSHPAVDIRIPEGTPAIAVANGIVKTAESKTTGFGKYIVLEVPDAPLNGGTESLYIGYAHLSEIDVSVGQIVRRGDVIGKTGTTGTSTTPHLHFQIDRADASFHLYWPFTTAEASAAGYDFFGAINAGFGLDNALKYTVNPMEWVQENENGSSSSNDVRDNEPEAELDAFELDISPSAVDAGDDVKITITAIDSEEKTMKSFQDSVSLTSSDSDMEIPDVAFKNGVAQFSVETVNPGRVKFSVESDGVKESLKITVNESENLHPSGDGDGDGDNASDGDGGTLDHFSFRSDETLLKIGGETTLTITAMDENGNLIPDFSPKGGYVLQVTNGKTDRDTLTKAHFSNGEASVTFTAEDAGKGKVFIENYGEWEIDIIAELKPVNSFSIETDGRFIVGVPEMITITSLDEEGNVTPKSFPGEAYVTFTEGEGITTPNELTSEDFENGIASVSVNVSEGGNAQIKVKSGVLVGESDLMKEDRGKIFADVGIEDEHADAIKFLKEKGVIGGYPDGTFRGSNNLNRVEATKMLMEGFNYDIESGTPDFRDVASSDWFTSYVYTAVMNGVVNGYPDGTFRPGGTLIRAEFFKLLLEADESPIKSRVSEDPFNDVSADAWYAPYARYAKDNELLDFGNKFKPESEITRDEVAEAMYRLMK